MTTGLSVLIASGSLILFLVVLFAIEGKRGARFLPRLRGWLDRVVAKIAHYFRALLIRFSSGKVRLAFHYFVHKALAFIARVAAKVQSSVLHLQLRNKRIARLVTKQKSNNHLSQLQAHQKASALTQEEKDQLRERTLEGG